LRESEARYRMLVESVREYAIMMLDPEGRVTSWNAGARKLFGFHDYEVLGQHVRRLYPPDAVRNREPEGDLINARNATNAPTERWLMRKDGSRFFSGGALSPVFDHFGRVCGYSKVVRDVTDRIEGGRRISSMQASRTTLVAGLDKLVARPLERLQKKLVKLSDGRDAANSQEITSCLQILQAATNALTDLRHGAEAHEIKSAATGPGGPALADDQPIDRQDSST
jgi:PAS domain S-box-containing protein